MARRRLPRRDGKPCRSTRPSPAVCRSATPGTPRDLGARLDAVRARSRSAQALQARSGSPTKASSSTRRSRSRPPTTRRGSAASRRPRDLFLPAARRPRSAPCSATPTWPTPTSSSRPRASTAYDGRARHARSSGPCSTRRSSRRRPAVRPGLMEPADLARYTRLDREPTTVDYRGNESTAWRRPPRGGSTVGEALNILEHFRPELADRRQALHRYLEASALAFADRTPTSATRRTSDVPPPNCSPTSSPRSEPAPSIRTRRCTSPSRPASRTATTALPAGAARPRRRRTEGSRTTHLTVADKPGNIASYTLTIEQTGGSGITVPGRGFLLNNELTDFTFEAADPHARPEPARPGQAAAQQHVADDRAEGRRAAARRRLPGRLTIITTVLQTLVNRIDRGMTLPEAIAAPRASQRNTRRPTPSRAFLEKYGARWRRSATSSPRRRDRRRDRHRVPAGGLCSPPRNPNGAAAERRASSTRSPGAPDADDPRLAPRIGNG